MSIEFQTQWQSSPIGDAGSSVGNASFPWTYYSTKSAREQVQDEILIKIQKALADNDLPRARELAELGKQITEF